MVEKTKNRKLFKQTAPCWFSYDAESLPDSIQFTAGGNGWRIAPGPTLALFREEYFDLSGWNVDDLSFFLSNVDFQHGHPPHASAQTVEGLVVVDILSLKRLDAATLGLEAFYPIGFDNIAAAAGLGYTAADLQHIIYKERRTYAIDKQIESGYLMTSLDTAGSGTAIAHTKLYWYRIIGFTDVAASGTSNLIVGGANCVIEGVTGVERDLVYIERLRRNYILGQ